MKFRSLSIRILYLFISLLPLLLTACISHTVHLQEGVDNFRLQNYRKAFIYLKPEAERGQPDAQYAIGYMYYYGQGVVEDRDKAWFWIHMAARLGQPDAIQAVKILGPAPPVR